MNYGWGGYSLSKEALNNLITLYAEEMPNTHFLSLAPGLVDTDMQEYLCGEVDSAEFPSVQKLRDARGTDNMRSEEHTSELQSRGHLVCRLLLEKKNTNNSISYADFCL